VFANRVYYILLVKLSFIHFQSIFLRVVLFFRMSEVARSFLNLDTF
jgi:hypothetical protein